MGMNDEGEVIAFSWSNGTIVYFSGHWDGASIHIAGTGYRKQLEAFARRIARFKIIFIPEVS
jgi:hypothetical protein